jgi:hypothetical protein
LLSLLGQGPALQFCASCQQASKLLLASEGHKGICSRLHGLPFSAQAMQDTGKVEGERQGIGMPHLPGQPDGLLTLLQRLIGIAEPPQDPGRNALAAHAWDLLSVAESNEAILDGIIQSQPLCEVRPRRGQLSQVE